MSFEQAVISVQNVGKCYQLYDKPSDRLRQFLAPRLHAMLRRQRRDYFREFWALRDVSFDIYRGDQVGIVGRNGAGKSTLLQIICGTLTPSLGSVETRGRIAALLELGAGFNPELTGRENVFLNGSVLGLDRRQIEERFDAILSFADIGRFIDQPVKNYSSGMYMRLAFAIASHVEPDVLIVDEALSVGDEAFQRKCNARIQSIRDAGATILFVSHSASHVVEVCNRAILLDRGELLAAGSPRHVVTRYHKLLYAREGAADQVRNEILGESFGNRDEEARTTEAAMPSDRSWLDEAMVPQSTVVYPSHGCEIIQPRLETPEGRPVNVLEPGAAYVYCYKVVFESPAAAVNFGMMIRTLRGVELGGATSTPRWKPHDFFPGRTEVEVRFSFRACLAPGTYFLNAGVLSLEAEESRYLARVVDAAMFKVLEQEDRCFTGLVDFQIETTVSRV